MKDVLVYNYCLLFLPKPLPLSSHSYSIWGSLLIDKLFIAFKYLFPVKQKSIIKVRVLQDNSIPVL